VDGVRWLLAIVVAWGLAACSDPGEGESAGAPTAPARDEPTKPEPTESVATSPAPSPTTSTPEPAPTFDPAAAFAVVEHLAGSIGPREATSAAFQQAAADVESRLIALGYDITRTPVQVPAGTSWGVDVPAGTSANIIADPPGFDPSAPHVVVGAHLDTVPQAPGAEDNASGVGVVVELARMAATAPPRVPVRFIAFGAEEPRGEGDALHHFGSRQYVADLPADQASAMAAMVSLDRVGVAADHVPVCTGGRGTTAVRDALVAAAATVGVPVEACENRASDHWSFEKAGLPSARLGSIPFEGYHSPQDVPAAVDATQLDRVGRIMWAWLQTL
jgi:Zn-dependent M28 family amino/carboxypeptidase